MIDNYYLWNTVLRFLCAGFLCYAIFNPKAGLFLKVMAGYFGMVALTRGIFIYRAGLGMQQTDPLMLLATSLEGAALLGMALLCYYKKFD